MQQSPAQFLTFTIVGQRFAVRADDVLEIVRAVRLSRLPKAPPIVEGVIDWHGTIVPVLDIRARFRLPPKGVAPSDHFIIARAGSRTIAVRVGRTMALVALHEADIAEIGAIAPTSDYVAGVAKLADGLVLIHDLATFLSEAEARELAGAVEEGAAA